MNSNSLSSTASRTVGASGKMTNYRWVICMMLFIALVINYLDRQVLSLTWVNFIAP